MRWTLAALLLVHPLGAFAARPAAPVQPIALCTEAVGAAEAQARLPARLLHVIASVESGRTDPRTGAQGPWPWTINADGVGSVFETRAEAIAAVAALQARGVRSIDVGCMQVNLMYHPDAFASLEQAFEPRANAAYAARFLGRLFAQTGDWPKAAAAYHSQTPERGAEYLRRVMALWAPDQVFPGGQGFATVAPARPSPYTAAFAARVAEAAADRARLYAEMRAPARAVAAAHQKAGQQWAMAAPR